jgi:hypothetical protein
MIINGIASRYRILMFYLLYFFWDRLFEGLFNITFAGTLRPIVIVSIWVYTLLNLKYLKSTVNHYDSLIKYFYFASLLVLTISAISLYRGIPTFAIIYTYLQHYGFVPLVLHVLSFAHQPVYVKKILIVLMISTTFLSIGVIADSYIGMSNIFNIEGINHMTRLGIQGVKRGDFTIGSTNVFITLSVGMVAAYLLITKFRYKLIYSYFALFIMTIGCYASYSRFSTIVGFLFIIAITTLLLVKKHLSIKILVLVAVTSIGLITFYNINILKVNAENIARFENIGSEHASGNFSRFNAWRRGANILKDPKNLAGNGAGSTNPRTRSLFNNKLFMFGFESSMVSRYYEGGIFGLILFLLPLFLCVKVYLKRQLDVIIVIWMLLLYVNFTISPSAQGYPSNLIIFIATSFSLLFSTYRHKKYISH